MSNVTQANWPRHLLIDSGTYREDIFLFNDWSQSHSPGVLPFQKITWWRDGRCCVHSRTLCRVCRDVLGVQTLSNTSAADPPSESSRQDCSIWDPFMRRWDFGVVAEPRHQAQNRRNARHLYNGGALRALDFTVPTYFNPHFAGHPGVRQGELYIFPTASIRILLQNELTGQSGYLRIPEMSMANLMDNLLGEGESLYLRYWRRGEQAAERRMCRGFGYILDELNRGARGGELPATMERCLRIREA
ncbi:uncharacterized protein RCC_07378 [Ramularia collo-cygni]|uniref:Uncharacterized protein n=1 Tax=Ramularia collo-cygni TaxID=112498 RepID=A0A2D3V4A9_9PEZI|nr:uncharacterized protein RCC_07378 [Ramularia collo-cygni]CZT21515.1 uncharacterized protein RCC_07378 [Ramularia collo-cygni]